MLVPFTRNWIAEMAERNAECSIKTHIR